MKDEQTVKVLTYGELMLLCEGHGTSQIYERHLEALAARERAVWLEAAKYWDAPDWHALAERYPADEYPKWSDSFAAWCRQQAEAVQP